MRRTPDEWENARGFREGCPCEDRFVGVMERRRGPCDAVELDDELFGRHRDAGAARRRQTERQVVSVQRRIEARDRDGELLSATRATPEKLSTLRRLHIKLAVRVATLRRYVERLRAR